MHPDRFRPGNGGDMIEFKAFERGGSCPASYTPIREIRQYQHNLPESMKFCPLSPEEIRPKSTSSGVWRWTAAGESTVDLANPLQCMLNLVLSIVL